jgi:hypothetical protein
MMKVLTAPSQVGAFLALPLSDKLRVARTTVLAQWQAHQRRKPYQRLRYWSTVPFHHGADVVKYSATPAADNQARALERGDANALQNELNRHLDEDGAMSSFDFGVQLCDPDKMTYWGKARDAAFWVENASVGWKEGEAAFHRVARLTLLPRSQLPRDAAEASYFDVKHNATPDSAPVGSINRARWRAEFASRQARTCPAVPKCSVSVPSDQADAACLAEGPGRS